MPHEYQQKVNNISGGEYKLNAHWMKLVAFLTGGEERKSEEAQT